MNWKSFLIYIVLNILWCIIFYKTIPDPVREVIPLLIAGSFFYTLFWLLLVIIVRITGNKSNRIILLLPLVLIIFAYFMIEEYTFPFIAGLICASELSLLHSLWKKQ